MAERPEKRRTLFEMCRDLRSRPELLEDRDGAKVMLDGFIRDALRYGFDLERQFEDALAYVRSELHPCKGLFTDSELRRIIGTEIAWRRIVDQEQPCFRQTPRELETRREAFVFEARFGADPLTDENSPTKRMAELETYLRSWRDFPAFGFGIQALDDATGGMLPGEICVLTGAPGTMKTSLALGAVDDFVSRAKEGLVYYCSVDMAPREITQRLMERESRVPQMTLRAMSDRDDPKLPSLRQRISQKYDGRLVIRGHSETKRMTLDRLLPDCLKRQPQLVVIDYFTRLKAAGQSDWEFVENAMPEILRYAHQYQWSFLILSQMSRMSRSEQAEGRAGGHGKGGGIVEEMAHTEIELFQQYVDGDKPLVIAAVTKARRGIAGQFFSLDYDGPIKRFSGHARKMIRARSPKPVFEVKDNNSLYGKYL
jgi:hypothetical protein